MIFNNATGLAFWIKRSKILSFLNWEDFLRGVLFVGRLTNQEIKLEPDLNSKSFEFIGDDCFHVKNMLDNWIKITTEGLCEDEELTMGRLKSDWIKWKDKDTLLIDYFLTM